MRVGFTLIEILVVVGIFILILNIGLAFSFDFYRQYFHQDEMEIFINALTKARNHSLNNVGQLAHGVCYDPLLKSYILFPDNDIFKGSRVAEIISHPSIECNKDHSNGIIFSTLSATTTETIIQIFQNSSTSTIKINSLGAILW